jgi:hypothetical protein
MPDALEEANLVAVSDDETELGGVSQWHNRISYPHGAPVGGVDPSLDAETNQRPFKRETKSSSISRLEIADAPPDSNGKVYRRSADGHNHARRRGLPIISKGVGARHREQIRYELCSARRLGASCVSSSR